MTTSDTWCCPLCGSTDDSRQLNACRHMLDGETHTTAGEEIVFFDSPTPPAIPTWACVDSSCPELVVCGECASNFPAAYLDVERALAAKAGAR